MQNSKLSCGLILSIQMIVLAFSYKIPKTEDQTSSKNNVKSKTCWQTERYQVLTECTPCSSDEMLKLATCKESGNKQLVKCESSNTTLYKSCKVAAALSKGHFWKFEALVLAGTVLSNVVVWWRRRALNHAHYQRVKRQMSCAAI